MGEAEEAAEFCKRVRPRLVGALTLFCGDVAIAEDLTQEALARAWERWDTIRVLDHRDKWVFKTAFNLARSSFRRAGAERRANRRARDGYAASVVLPDVAVAIAVRAAVRGLPERQRAAIVARFYLGLDVAASAEVMRCRPGTVKALTHQAIVRLRGCGLTDFEEVTDNV